MTIFLLFNLFNFFPSIILVEDILVKILCESAIVLLSTFQRYLPRDTRCDFEFI